MKNLFIVAGYTIKEMIKRKSFIISNAIILLIIIIGSNVPSIIDMIKGDNTELFANKVLIVDEKNIFENSLVALNDMKLGAEFTIENKVVSFEDIKQKIEDKDIKSAIVINSKDNAIKLEYIVKNLGTVQQVPQDFLNAITSIYKNIQIQKLNLTQSELLALSPTFDFEIKQTDTTEISGNVIAIMLLSMVLFYAIYFCAYQVSTSITTEKTSRIMETLVTSTTPRIIVLGKTLGIGIVGLLQVIVIAIVGLVSVSIFMDAELVKQAVDMSRMTVGLGILTVIYFILGYTLYALMYALTGSTVSKPEDVQSANGPVAILSVIGFYLAYFSMMNPTSNINIFASIFPLSSPFCMPFRVMMGVATVPEISLSIALLVIISIIIAKISIRIYSQAILNYGTKMSLKDMIAMYKNK